MFLVTGAQGYLGAEVCAALERRGAAVVRMGRREGPGVAFCDLADPDAARAAIGALAPGLVVHCAAFVPTQLVEYEDAAAAEASLAMIDNLLAATQAPVLYVSSMTVYGGDDLPSPTPESAAGAPSSAYGRGKWLGEERFRAAGRAGWAVRIPGLFGGERKGGLVGNLIAACQRGEAPRLPDAPILWGAAHVRDMAEGIARLALGSAPATPTPINLGYDDAQSVPRLVSHVAEIFGRDLPYEVAHPTFQFDVTRARALGVAPERGLPDALREVAEDLSKDPSPAHGEEA